MSAITPVNRLRFVAVFPHSCGQQTCGFGGRCLRANLRGQKRLRCFKSYCPRVKGAAEDFYKVNTDLLLVEVKWPFVQDNDLSRQNGHKFTCGGGWICAYDYFRINMIQAVWPVSLSSTNRCMRYISFDPPSYIKRVVVLLSPSSFSLSGILFHSVACSL